MTGVPVGFGTNDIDKGWSFAVVDVLALFADVLGIPLQKIKLMARLFPDVSEHKHVFV